MGGKTICANMKEILFWPHMRREILKEAMNCKECLIHSKTKRNTQPIIPVELQMWAPGECISLDCFQKWRKEYLAGVDKTSGLILCAQIPNKKATTITRVLDDWVTFFGLPSVLKTDGAMCFTAELVNDFCS